MLPSFTSGLTYGVNKALVKAWVTNVLGMVKIMKNVWVWHKCKTQAISPWTVQYKDVCAYKSSLQLVKKNYLNKRYYSNLQVNLKKHKCLPTYGV